MVKGKVAQVVEQEQDSSKKGEDLKNVKFAILPDAPFNFSLAGKNVKVVFVTLLARLLRF